MNQYSALVGDLERIFFAPTLKIVLQHIRGQAEVRDLLETTLSHMRRSGMADHSDEPQCGPSIKSNSLNMPSFMHQKSVNLC